MRHRSVLCATPTGSTVDAALCWQLNKPHLMESCDTGSCVANKWFTSAWSNECKGRCGEGFVSRDVFCPFDGNDSGSSSNQNQNDIGVDNSVLPKPGVVGCEGKKPK